jgi:hypothetical protein
MNENYSFMYCDFCILVTTEMNVMRQMKVAASCGKQEFVLVSLMRKKHKWFEIKVYMLCIVRDILETCQCV